MIKKILYWILLGVVISQIFKSYVELNYYLFAWNVCLFIFIIKKLIVFNLTINLNINNNFKTDKDDTSKSIKN